MEMTSPLLTKNNGEIVLFLNSLQVMPQNIIFGLFCIDTKKVLRKQEINIAHFFGRILEMVSPLLAEDNAGINLFSGLV